MTGLVGHVWKQRSELEGGDSARVAEVGKVELMGFHDQPGVRGR